MLKDIQAWMRLGYGQLLYWVIGMTPESHHWGQAYNWMLLGRWRNSIKHCDRYLSYRKDDDILAILGYCYGNLGNWSESAAAYRSHSNIFGDKALALGLAEAELQLGNEDRAREIVAIVEVSQDYADRSVIDSLNYLKDRMENVEGGADDV